MYSLLISLLCDVPFFFSFFFFWKLCEIYVCVDLVMCVKSLAATCSSAPCRNTPFSLGPLTLHGQVTGFFYGILMSLTVIYGKVTEQDCIPVGCVPPVCCLYLPACTALWGGAWSGGCLPLVPGGAWSGGVLASGPGWGGGGVSQHAMGQTPSGQNS